MAQAQLHTSNETPKPPKIVQIAKNPTGGGSSVGITPVTSMLADEIFCAGKGSYGTSGYAHPFDAAVDIVNHRENPGEVGILLTGRSDKKNTEMLNYIVNKTNWTLPDDVPRKSPPKSKKKASSPVSDDVESSSSSSSSPPHTPPKKTKPGHKIFVSALIDAVKTSPYYSRSNQHDRTTGSLLERAKALAEHYQIAENFADRWNWSWGCVPVEELKAARQARRKSSSSPTPLSLGTPPLPSDLLGEEEDVFGLGEVSSIGLQEPELKEKPNKRKRT